MPELEATLAPTNAAAYASTLAKLGTLGDMRFDSITATDLLEWGKTTGGSVLTQKGHMTRARAMLNRLGRSITVKLPKPPKKRKTTVWGREQAEFMSFIRGLPDNRKVALGLLYIAGLRRSEACGLMFRDIRGNGADLRVSVTETEEAVFVRPVLKTESSMSYVSLGKELVGWIGKGKGFVLTGTDEPMRPRSLTQLVRRTVAGTKWSSLRPQSLRRGHGQAIVEKTGNMLLVSASLRNSVAVASAAYTDVDSTLKDQTHSKVFRSVPKRVPKKQQHHEN